LSGTRVCVIGGGPGGLTAAIEGARQGLAVDLFERDQIGEHIRCAEGFFDSFRLLGEPGAGVRFKVDQAVLKFEREFTVDCRTIPLWMIDRREWQQDLAGQARLLGVRIFAGRVLTAAQLDGLMQDYDWVIDASGVPSLASIRYGFRSYYRSNGAVTCQYQLAGDFSRFGKTLKFVIFPNYEGYYWIFPKGKDAQGIDQANVGIGLFGAARCEGPVGPGMWKTLDRVLADERIKARVIRRHGGLVPVRLLDQLQYGNLLLVGDAAGAASPLHGGGIDLAVLTARIAVSWIAAQQQKDGNYTQMVRQMLRRKQDVERKVCDLWQRLDLHTLDQLAGLILHNLQAGWLPVVAGNFWTLAKNMRTGWRLREGIYRGRW
jgi:digeranylgeranylglycerophospholipid reductase